jgi:predicted DsbA family dithiol-disulfide isomerase
MYEQMFKLKDLHPTELPQLAVEMGLDVERFDRCLTGETTEEVRNDMLIANRFGLRTTPTFFVGNLAGSQLRVKKLISGSQPLVSFQAAIEAVLASGAR